MKMRTIALVLTAALVAGCSGGTSRLLPSTFSPGAAPEVAPDGAAVSTLVRVRIPRRTGHRPERHPATISPLTHSVAIAVDTAKAQIFNTTPSSPGCAIGSAGLTCTFAVRAKAGTDTFTVTTYGGIDGTGTALDRGIAAKIPIVKGKANRVAVSLGPLVTTAANSGIGSLRYAIGSANAGDTVTFALPSGTTIALASPITINGNVSIAGPGYTELTISGGNAHQLFAITGRATISGVTLTHGKAAQSGSPGGAIQNGGTLTLAYDYIGSSTSIEAIGRAPNAHERRAHKLHPHSCSSTTFVEGGGVYNNGSLTVSHTIFNANVLTNSQSTCVQGNGGAIYNDVNGALSSTDDTYTANSAAAGGAVYNAGYGAATFTGDTFTGNYGCNATNGCPTSGCAATACTSMALGEGAAIYDAGTGITVTGSAFTDNVAGGKTAGSVGQGGAIYLDSVVPSITKSTFTGNLAGGGTTSCSNGSGGAIFSVNLFEIDGDTFKNNEAIGDQSATGGAVAGQDSVTGTSDAFNGNVASSTGGPCTANSVGGGGGVFSAADIVTFTSSTFVGNSAVGGSLAAAGALGGDSGIVNNCTFTSNSVTATGAGATQATSGGGAVEFGSFGKVAHSTFVANTSTAESAVAQDAFGGAFAVSMGNLISNGNTFTSNKAIEKNAAQGAIGGAMVALNQTLVSTGDTFTSNSATGVQGALGGALAATTGAQISNATLTSNVATAGQASGGGMAIGGTSATLTHVIATKNVAGGTLGAGGGLFDSAGASITNSSFSQNTAATAGGGIFSVNNLETVVASTVNDNVVAKANAAATGGGGIFAENGVNLVYSTVAGNTLTVGGPGPAGGAGVLNAGGMLLYESTVSGNTLLGSAPQSGGGGILSLDQIIALNSTISNNRSSAGGGGLYNADNAVNELMNVTLFKNAATGAGGNILNTAAGALSLQNTIVGGGTAATGADIDNPGSISSADYNIIQTAPAGTAITGTTTHDLIADPKLLALSNNGGPTFTNADQASSPGRERIAFASSECGGVPVPTDQRGYTRGAGGRCDVGAFEYAGVATAIARRPAIPKYTFRHKPSHYHFPKMKPLDALGTPHNL